MKLCRFFPRSVESLIHGRSQITSRVGNFDLEINFIALCYTDFTLVKLLREKHDMFSSKVGIGAKTAKRLLPNCIYTTFI